MMCDASDRCPVSKFDVYCVLEGIHCVKMTINSVVIVVVRMLFCAGTKYHVFIDHFDF